MKEANWKMMYMALLDGILETLDNMPDAMEHSNMRARLKKALTDAEEIYIQTTEDAGN